MSWQLKVKVEGPETPIRKLIERLEAHFIVFKTSNFIEHRENDDVHVYLTVLRRDVQ